MTFSTSIDDVAEIRIARALAAPASRQAPSRIELHRQWSELEEQYQELECHIVTAEQFGAADRRQLDEMKARQEALRLDINRHIEGMLTGPVTTPADIAVLLDLAFEYDVDPTCEEDKAAHLGALICALTAAAPGVELTAVRRAFGEDGYRKLLAAA